MSDIDNIKVGDSVDQVHETLGEPSGQLSGFWGDIYVLEYGKQAIIYYDSNGTVEQVKLSIDGNWYIDFNGKEITLDEVQSLAQKGEALTFENFKDFKGANVSSNTDYRIMLYGVEGNYRLIVRTDGKTLDSANLERVWDSGGSGIDIRYSDVDEFVKTHPSSEATGFELTSPELSLEQSVGIDMAELDYASDDIVIFHGYFGLFVYELNTQKIVRSLDLNPFGCTAAQGDDYCDVTVSADGNTVQLHPMSNKNMYVYTVSDNTLRETVHEPMSDRFGSLVPIENVIDSSKLGYYSHTAVKFDTGEYGYLHTSDWTLDTLSYVRDDMMYRLFGKDGWDGYSTTYTVTDSDVASAKEAVISYYQNTAFKSHVTDISQIKDISKFESAVIPQRIKDVVIAFYVTMSDNAKRMIVLTKELSGEWEVINEGV